MRKDNFNNALKVQFTEVAIYVDYHLGEENGQEVYFKLQELGFMNVALATGEIAQIHPQIRQVSKGFPFKPA